MKRLHSWHQYWTNNYCSNYIITINSHYKAQNFKLIRLVIQKSGRTPAGNILARSVSFGAHLGPLPEPHLLNLWSFCPLPPSKDELIVISGNVVAWWNQGAVATLSFWFFLIFFKNKVSVFLHNSLESVGPEVFAFFIVDLIEILLNYLKNKLFNLSLVLRIPWFVVKSVDVD